MFQRTNHVSLLRPLAASVSPHMSGLSGCVGLAMLAATMPCGWAQQSIPASASSMGVESTPTEQAAAKPHPMTPLEMATLSHDLEAAESRQLLELATDLKKQLNKTSENTLSLDIVRKADQIAHLARHLKERARLNLASN